MGTKGKSAAVNHLKKKLGSSYDETVGAMTLLTKRAGDRAWFDTGSLTLNKAINHRGRGIPGGAFTVLAGHSQAGKSLLGTLTLAGCQKQGGLAFLIDIEGSFDMEFAQQLGVDLDELVYIGPTRSRKIDKEIDPSSPLTVTDVFNIIEEILTFVEKNYPKDHPCVIVWDSISGTNTLRNLGLEKTGKDSYKIIDTGDPKREQGGPAQWMKAWLTRINARLATLSNIAMLGVSHVYTNVSGYSTREIVKGGSGLAYFATIRLLFSKRHGKKWQIFKDDDDEKGIVIGELLDVYVDKNTVGAPYTRVHMDFYFDDEGQVHLDRYAGLLDYFVKRDVITLNGAWYKYKDKSFYKKDFNKMMEEFPELKEM